jgi:hypothetical protein
LVKRRVQGWHRCLVLGPAPHRSRGVERHGLGLHKSRGAP